MVGSCAANQSETGFEKPMLKSVFVKDLENMEFVAANQKPGLTNMLTNMAFNMELSQWDGFLVRYLNQEANKVLQVLK